MSAASITDQAPNGELSDAQLRAAARDAYRASLAAGQPITGAELGRRFGLSDRWGRARVAETRREAVTGRQEAADGDGSQPTRDTRPRVRDTPRRPVRPAPTRRTSATGSTRQHNQATETDGDVAQWLRSAIIVVVGMVAAAASYGHMLHVALLAGEPLWIARAWPITVDGLVLAALLRGDKGRIWLALGAAVSVGANVLAQYPDLAEMAGPAISAWPPIALYGTHRLLHAGSHRSAGAKAHHDERQTTPGRGEG